VRRVVSDTGPILHLSEAQALDLLRLTGEVHIPPAVDTEILQHQADWQSQRPDWIIVDVLVAPRREEATAWQQADLLGIGEAEAIALAQQLGADWLLTDDAAARLFAQALGREVHGSLGVVLWSAAAGHLDQPNAEATLDRLARSSLWLSARVLAEAKTALDQLCDRP
jgi:predicted nucleic acid-binding protein